MIKLILASLLIFSFTALAQEEAPVAPIPAPTPEMSGEMKERYEKRKALRYQGIGFFGFLNSQFWLVYFCFLSTLYYQNTDNQYNILMLENMILSK